MSAPFIVMALPRSRSFWASKFLSYGEWHCGHDELRHARSMDDVKSWLAQPCTGTVETLGAPWWRLARQYAPEARIVVLRRPVAAVVAGLVRLGFDEAAMWPMMRRLDRKLEQIEARVPGVLSVTFDDLATEEGCARVFEHCLPYQHDSRWWGLMAQHNLQADMRAIVRYVRAFYPQMEKLAKMAKHLTLAGMRPADGEIEGMTIQEEPFHIVYPECRRAFEEHCVRIGESPDWWATTNLPHMAHLSEMGALQFVTARCNGRIFGYLMAALTPSLGVVGATSSMHLTFFADPSVPRLGMKLQRKSVDLLKTKGAGELILRNGIRGDGPRLDVLYRRMGAEFYGGLYRLDLAEVA